LIALGFSSTSTHTAIFCSYFSRDYYCLVTIFVFLVTFRKIKSTVQPAFVANGDKRLKPRVQRGLASETLGIQQKRIRSLKGSSSHLDVFVAFSDGNICVLRPRVPFAFAHSTLGFIGLSPLATKTTALVA
jgi:hypothetical protein